MAISYYRDTCSSIFIAVLFKIARKNNQPSYPSNDECRLWKYGTHNEFYWAAKINKIMEFAGKWIDLGRRNEMSQVTKD